MATGDDHVTLGRDGWHLHACSTPSIQPANPATAPTHSALWNCWQAQRCRNPNNRTTLRILLLNTVLYLNLCFMCIILYHMFAVLAQFFFLNKTLFFFLFPTWIIDVMIFLLFVCMSDGCIIFYFLYLLVALGIWKRLLWGLRQKKEKKKIKLLKQKPPTLLEFF